METVETNPWLICAALFALKIVGTGWAWGWALVPRDGEPRGAAAWIGAIARIAATGLAAVLVVTLALAALDLYRPVPEALALGAVAAAGLALARRRAAGPHARAAGATAVLLFAGVALVMNLPHRGEWVAGGWDPGIYVGEGVRLERTGRLFPEPDPFYAGLSADELGAFTRRTFNFTEAMPVVPVDPETRALVPFFFRLTPAFVATVHRCGGLRAATRVNDFAGLLILLLFPAFLLRSGAGGAWTAFATALLATHPLWLYHLHFPTSEMLQLALVCGIGLLLPDRARTGPAAGLAVLMFLATVNRFSFLPFGALLLATMTWLDLEEGADRRRGATARLAALAALGAGAAFDLFANRLVLGRLGSAVPKLVVAAAAIAAVAAIIEWIARRPDRRATIRGAFDLLAFPLAMTLMTAAAVLFAIRDHGILRGAHAAVAGALPFLGPAMLAFAAAGALGLILRRPGFPPVLRAWLCVALGATLLTIAQPDITPWWPWAARRFVEFTLPALALLAAAPAAALWQAAAGRRALQAAAVLLAAAPAVLAAPTAMAACRATEFDGLTRSLAGAAVRIEPGDLVVADHFRWGTPLRLLFGAPIVNGELFWDRDGGAARWTNALPVLRRLQQQGRRVRVFAGTDEGLSLFPGVPADLKPDWTSGPWPCTEVMQHPRAKQFKTVEKVREFRLYTLPALPAPGG